MTLSSLNILMQRSSLRKGAETNVRSPIISLKIDGKQSLESSLGNGKFDIVLWSTAHGALEKEALIVKRPNAVKCVPRWLNYVAI